MTHLWVRTESRQNEQRVGITPEGVAEMIAAGYQVTVEESSQRIIPINAYRKAGAEIAAEGSWPDAPKDAIIFGLKELPEEDTPLIHRHIMFGHAYKGQSAGQRLLKRFKAGGGTLFDLEYLVNEQGRRVAAFGYWAGYAGAAVALRAWAAQKSGGICPPMQGYANAKTMCAMLRDELDRADQPRPDAIVIGALGRVGTGASDLCGELGVDVTKWDMKETAHGGPFPEILEHDVFLNCILAGPRTPVFVPASAKDTERKLSVIGDIACDPDSDFNPVPLYHEATTWAEPATRVHDDTPLDVTAIDNLPSMLPLESSQDFSGQLLPWLMQLEDTYSGVWGRAMATYRKHLVNI
ncbi:saccharopine dehydrogenase [Donghicola eburneus]|uniref:Saccharopine dehydrogenase [NAD(+), L-lysine-forming] n=1 Tax=Donghicola eburneus TaxID=393278 RepID=A0A1M4N462_9RHOB|nr:saccharopine dehydrogenase [Donghicola eburneus]SCM69621.1 Saccharopine dehydrogenase [NAD(+), L-lysine-forming] [Donghicola eburneus]SFQ49262.1 saccharopine dehydrogenase (NAD+, L-lysine-forming) [Donghicola eburneus]